MKKLYTIIPVILLFFACDSTPSYKITGQISSGSVDGKTVYLEDYLWYMHLADQKVLDSTIVKNGKFKFKGKTDSAYIAILNIDNRPAMIFIVENGDIQLNIPENINESLASGTKLNDSFNSYRESLDPVKNKLTELSMQINSSGQTDNEEFMREMDKKYQEFMNEMLQISIEFLDENPGTILSAFILVSSLSQGIDPEAAQNVYDKLDDKVKSSTIGNFISQILAEMKSTEITAGETYHDMTMKTPDGKDISLSDYAGKGKYVLIDFWASWCGPCRKENPNLVALYKEYKNRDFEIVGVSLDNNRDAWIKGIKDDNITWPQMSDLKGGASELVRQYGVKVIPYTVLLDKEGKVIETNLSGEKLKNKLETLIR
jgi:peroxiredoxin